MCIVVRICFCSLLLFHHYQQWYSIIQLRYSIMHNICIRMRSVAHCWYSWCGLGMQRRNGGGISKGSTKRSKAFVICIFSWRGSVCHVMVCTRRLWYSATATYANTQITLHFTLPQHELHWNSTERWLTTLIEDQRNTAPVGSIRPTDAWFHLIYSIRGLTEGVLQQNYQGLAHLSSNWSFCMGKRAELLNITSRKERPVTKVCASINKCGACIIRNPESASRNHNYCSVVIISGQ